MTAVGDRGPGTYVLRFHFCLVSPLFCATYTVYLIFPIFFKHHIYHFGAGVAQSVLRGDCELDSPKFEILAAARDFSLVHNFQTGSVAHPASWRDASHLPPSIADVKNEWSCTSAPPICLCGWMGTTSPLLFLTNIYHNRHEFCLNRFCKSVSCRLILG